MVNVSQSLENDYLRMWQPLVHFDRQPQRRKNVGISHCEEGWGRNLIEPVESIVECAGIALGLECVDRHIVFMSLGLVLYHLNKMLFVIRSGGNPQLKELYKSGR